MFHRRDNTRDRKKTPERERKRERDRDRDIERREYYQEDRQFRYENKRDATYHYDRNDNEFSREMIRQRSEQNRSHRTTNYAINSTIRYENSNQREAYRRTHREAHTSNDKNTISKQSQYGPRLSTYSRQNHRQDVNKRTERCDHHNLHQARSSG